MNGKIKVAFVALLATITIYTIKNVKIGQCSQEVEDKLNKQND